MTCSCQVSLRDGESVVGQWVCGDFVVGTQHCDSSDMGGGKFEVGEKKKHHVHGDHSIDLNLATQTAAGSEMATTQQVVPIAELFARPGTDHRRLPLSPLSIHH